MSSPAPEKEETPATTPHDKIEGHSDRIVGVLRLPGGQRTITCSWDGTLRTWDLKSGAQVGEAWQDEGSGRVHAIVLSPDGKNIASGSEDGAVRLWDINTGKVITKWTGHTGGVLCVCWSPDGERVVSGSEDGTVRIWDVGSGQTILEPIDTGHFIPNAVCYSPNAKMIATGGYDSLKIRKFDTTSWTQSAVLEGHKSFVNSISLSPGGRILASASNDSTARLWNLESNQPIGPPLTHEGWVRCGAFSADGKLLTTGCDDHLVYKWDVSVIVREAGLDESDNDAVNESSLNADATQGAASQIEEEEFFGARDNIVDYSTSRNLQSYSYGRRVHRNAPAPHQPLLHRLQSLLRPRHSNPHTGPERGTSTPFRPLGWAQNLVSATLRRRDGSDIELQAPRRVVEVPYAKGKPDRSRAER